MIMSEPHRRAVLTKLKTCVHGDSSARLQNRRARSARTVCHAYMQSVFNVIKRETGCVCVFVSVYVFTCVRWAILGGRRRLWAP